ncbi:GntR family transcriptional regulator [Leucobacter sp. M11]|nr:GntR family transcriptional regulator [Leucobacter sp. M11]
MSTREITVPLPPRTTAPDRRLLGHSVYDRLLDAITRGELAPGETLRDTELSEWLGVSRSPIRDALKRLSDIGLVEFVPHRFTRVTPIDPRQQLEISVTLTGLYELAYAAGVPELDDADRLALSEIAERVLDAGRRSDGDELGIAMHEYCLLLAKRSRNALLLQSMDLLAAQLRMQVSEQTQLADPAAGAALFAATHEAVLAGEADLAAARHRDFAAMGRQSFRILAGHEQPSAPRDERSEP